MVGNIRAGKRTPGGCAHQVVVGASVGALRCRIVKVYMNMSHRLSVIAQRRPHNGSRGVMTTQVGATVDVVEHV
jgi:hypothetical protein